MKTLKICSLLAFFLFFSSCFLRKTPRLKAQKFLSKGQCKTAYQFYKSVPPNKQKKIALQAAEECQNKHQDPLSAFLFYESLLDLNLKYPKTLSFKEQKNIEFKLAELAFYDLKNYMKAIKYYKQQLKFVPQPKRKFFIHYQIADAFFLLKKPNQALKEIEKIFQGQLSLQDSQKIWILKGRILIFQQKLLQAIQLFKQMIKKYPKQEDLFREYLSLIYEEKKDFRKAIREMKKINNPTPFTRKKIQYLYERFKNQPGVRL